MRRAILIVLGLALLGGVGALAYTWLRPRGPVPVLANGRFIDVRNGLPTGWHPVTWVADNTIFAAMPPGDDGGGVLRIANVSGNDARLCQTVSLDPGMTYRIAATVRTEDVGTDLIGALVTVEPRVADTIDLRGTRDWQRLELTAAANGLSSWDVCLRLGSYGNLNTGTAYFRDVEVRPMFVRPTRWLPQMPSDPRAFVRVALWSPTTAAVVGGLLLAYGFGILGNRWR